MKSTAILLSALSLIASRPCVQAQHYTSEILSEIHALAPLGVNSNFTAKLEYREEVSNGGYDICDVTESVSGLNSCAEVKYIKEWEGRGPHPSADFLMIPDVTIINCEKHLLTIIELREKSYASDPFRPLTNNPPPTKTELTKETIDNHPCVKSKVTTTDVNGQAIEAFVWNATDLHDFPVQVQMTFPVRVQMTQGSATVTVHYTEIKFGPPDASVFEPPHGFTNYDSIGDMIHSTRQIHITLP